MYGLCVRLPEQLFVFSLIWLVALAGVYPLIIAAKIKRVAEADNNSTAYGVLFQTLHADAPLWRLMLCLRRILILAVPSLLWEHPIRKSQGFVVVISLMLYAHIFARPYATRRQNRLEFACLGALTVVSLASLEMAPDPLQEFKASIDKIVTSLIILAVLVLCVFMTVKATIQGKKEAPLLGLKKMASSTHAEDGLELQEMKDDGAEDIQAKDARAKPLQRAHSFKRWSIQSPRQRMVVVDGRKIKLIPKTAKNF